jgi:hypothetical protein
MRSSQCNYLWKVHLSYLAVDCSAELSKYGKMFLFPVDTVCYSKLTRLVLYLKYLCSRT